MLPVTTSDLLTACRIASAYAPAVVAWRDGWIIYHPACPIYKAEPDLFFYAKGYDPMPLSGVGAGAWCSLLRSMYK